MAAKLDPVTLEVIRNALPAISNEMAADLQRTSYNMMIYEVRDFCTALISTEGELISQNVGGVSHFVADLGVIITDGMKRYGRDGFQDGDVLIMNHPRRRRAASQQHLHLRALFLQGRAVDVLDGARALDRCRRHEHRLRRRPRGAGSVDGRAAIRPAQNLRRRQAQRDAASLHQGQYPLPGKLARRSALADRGVQARQSPRRRALRALWPRHGDGGDPPSLRRDRAALPQRGEAIRRRRLRGRNFIDDTGETRRRAGEDPRQDHREARRDDHRPIGMLERAPARTELPLARRRAHRLQGDHPADRSGQRRLVPRARHHPARGQFHDGAASDPDAGLEPDAADGRRHDRRGARPGDERQGAGRPSRRSRRLGFLRRRSQDQAPLRLAEHRWRRLGRPAV